MKAKEVTREYRLAQWAQIIQERTESGQRINAFCENKGISRFQYYYWLRVLRETACERAEQLQKIAQGLAVPAFTEVKLSDELMPRQEAGGKIQVEVGPCKINADAGYPAESLAILLRELVRV